MGPTHLYVINVENSYFGHLYNPVESKVDDEHFNIHVFAQKSSSNGLLPKSLKWFGLAEQNGSQSLKWKKKL